MAAKTEAVLDCQHQHYKECLQHLQNQLSLQADESCQWLSDFCCHVSAITKSGRPSLPIGSVCSLYRRLNNWIVECPGVEIITVQKLLAQNADTGQDGDIQFGGQRSRSEGLKRSAGTCILIGSLKVTKTKDAKPDTVPEIGFHDHSDSIVVKVDGVKNDAVLLKLGKMVAVRDAILVHPSSSEVFLQLTSGPLSLSESDESSSVTLTAVNPQEAWRLLSIKPPASGVPITVNISGQITAVSEVIKIKESCLFLLQFSPGVTVVIKRIDCLFWQQLVQPQREYVITQLRPTTLQKGASNQSRVYTVTRHSRLLPADHITIETKNAENWLSAGYEGDLSHEVPDWEMPKLISYQGEVTRIIDGCLGVFELDNSIRLIVTRLPAVHQFRHLQVGARATLHNVHFKTAKQAPKLTLSMCMLSSIHLTRYSADTYTKHGSCSSVMLKCKYLHRLCDGKLEFLYNTKCCLQSQFAGMLTGRCIDKMMDVIIKVPQLSWQQDTSKGYRNYMDEFLATPHDCSLLGSPQLVCPKYMSVKQLVETMSSQSDSKDNWYHVRHKLPPEQIVTGLLTVSSSTGMIQLQDSTGSVDVVVCCCHADENDVCWHSNDGHRHKCNDLCDCSKNDVGKQFPCHILHTCCLGCAVAVTRCEAVTEFETVVDRDESSSDYNKLTQVKQYICFSLKDTFLLDSSNRVEQKTSKNKNLRMQCYSKKNSMVIKDVVKDKKCDKNVCGQQGDVFQTEGIIEACSYRKETSSDCEMNEKLPNQSAKESSYGRIEKIGPVLHRHVDGASVGKVFFCRNKDCLASDIQEGNINSLIEGQFDKEKLGLEHVQEPSNALRVKPINSPRKIFIGINVGTEVQREHKKLKMDEVFYKKCTIGKSDVKLDMVANEEDDEDVENKGSLHSHNIRMDSTSESNEQAVTVLNVKQIRLTQPNEVGNISGLNGQMSAISEMKSSDSECVLLVTRKELLSQNSYQSALKGPQFVVEGRILDDTDTCRKDIFHFHDKAIRWYPVLHCGAMYRLSVPLECSPLLSARLSNSRVEKVIHNSKVKKSYNVNEHVELEAVFVPEDVVQTEGEGEGPGISSILSIGCPDRLVDVHGILLQRSLMSPQSSREQHKYRQARSLHRAAHASGGFGHLCTRLLIKDLEGSSEIAVYLNHEGVVVPHGLLPGALVSMFSLERKVAKTGTVYLRALPTSCVLVTCLTRTPLAQNTSEANCSGPSDSGSVPFGSLVDLWGRKVKVRCVCDVLQVLKVSLKCTCTNCGSLVIQERCTNVGCFGGEASTFQARSSIIIDDGTSVAMVTLFGENVRRLLHLSQQQWTDFISQVNRAGEVFVQQSRPYDDEQLGQFVRRLCECPQTKQSWDFTLQHRGYSCIDLNTLEYEEFVQKSFETGSERITTHCLPFLQLDCVAMETFSPSGVALEILRDTTVATCEGQGITVGGSN